MSKMLARWWRAPARFCGGVALSLLLPAVSPAADKEALLPPDAPPAEVANEALLPPMAPPAAAAKEALLPPKEPPAAVAPVTTIKTVTLGECLALAFQNQPTLAAARAHLASAHTAATCLEKLHAIPLAPGSRELPIRRHQAKLGVAIANAALSQAEWESIYSVTRTYYSAVYAKAQEEVAADVVGSLRFYHERISEGVKKGEGPKEWTQDTVDKLTVYARMAEAKQAEAAQGVERANAALREAIGLGPNCCVRAFADNMSAPEVTVSLCDIVAQALERRGEIAQVNTALEVYHLEIDAQSKNCMPVTRTFAAGSDIHYQPLPTNVWDGEYRPGALAPEMPVNLVGSKCCRMERAKDLAGRASAVADKTHNLIVLEAEDGYYKWLELGRKVTVNREAATAGKRLAKNTRDGWRNDQKVKIDDVLTNEVIAAQAQSAYNESLYQYILALAALERITAGGFVSGLAPLPAGCH